MASPPTGTVTFLFTDIEGSTRMWERSPQAMQAALARHDELLRRAIEQRSGYVFKTVGDAFCCAFPTVPDALKAAVEIQRRLLSSEWEEIGPLRVRMALHTGAAEERDGDYFGPPLNRVARLLSHILVEPSMSVNRNVTVPVGGLATTTSMCSLLPLKRHYSSGAVPGPSVQRSQRSVWKKGFFTPKFMLQVSVGDWGA